MATRKTTLALMLALAACTRGTGTQDGGTTTAERIERADDPVPYQYVVVLEPGGGAVAEVAADLLGSTDAWTLRTYERALRGFAMHASEETALALSKDARVAWVAEDGRVRAQALAVQPGAPAGLDRIDQRTGTDGSYAYSDAEVARIHAYVLDTGVVAGHTEFLGRPPDQLDFVRDGQVGDCNGHGTHVAGILGGATFGVAKRVQLHSLRVLGCDGVGSTSDIVAALDWVVANAQTPAVVNLSLGRGPDAALDAAVGAVVAAGLPVVVAAGDARRDACASSPARVPGALTVASTDPSGMAAATFTNRGACVDLFAPGVDIRSASAQRVPGDLTFSGSILQSGTSASAPFVAGAVALYLAKETGATPDAIARALIANSTRAPASPPRYTPDRFLFTTFIDDDNSADAAAPTVTIGAPAAGATVSGEAVQVTVTASDDVGVTRVELFANGRFIASSVAAPHAFTWDSRRAPNGGATLLARAYDGAGHASDASVAVTVANVGIAHLDPVLGVPKCETLTRTCDSLDLLAGRADMGPEENAPNALEHACPTASDSAATCVCEDGPFGEYELDESIQRITVTRSELGNLAVGADVRVDVQVFIGSTYYDELDLYSSPTVVAPVWRHLGTLKAVASGLQTLTAWFTLPDGGLQAVRAALRYGGQPSTCTEGGFDERDDLAFVVASGTPDSAPPTGVEITSPRALDEVAGTIAVTAVATDQHMVSRVEFTVGSILVGTDLASPYAVTWNSGLVPNGLYDVRATAYDGAGNVTVSDPVKIEVKDETPPSVSIISPTTGTQVATTPIAVNVSAADNGVVKRADLRVRVVGVGGVVGDWTTYASTTTPKAQTASTTYYELSWSNVPGTYQLVARVYDGAGLTADSEPVTLVVGDTTPPTCIIKPPDNLSVVGSVLLEAEAADDTEVASVAFFRVGGAAEPFAVATTPPYVAAWESGALLNGSYQLYCLATDTSNHVSFDERKTVLTVADTTAPTVDILSPPVTHDPPASTTAATIVATPVSGTTLVRVEAADDGAIWKVDFFLDSSTVPFETLPTAPYEFLWDSGTVANGPHALTARAYDFNGHSTVSTAVDIVTNDATAPAVSILFPLTGATLTGVVPVRAQVSDPGGKTVKVELLDGTVVVGSSTVDPTPLPYEFSWVTTGRPLGAHRLTVRATDFVGNVGSASVDVTIATTTSSAVRVSTLGAPVCAAEGPSCHSNLLLEGRGPVGPVGPEPGQPNTLTYACPTELDPAAVCRCPDGSGGAYHADESIDFISVSSADGLAMTAGEEVEVEVRAWIFDAAQDEVALFYASDADGQGWVELPLLPPTGTGAQSWTTTYTLPNGAVQAVRASVRYGPLETGACVPGEYNDHDDLVFAVKPAADATPPTVSIDPSIAGAPLSGQVTVTATATDATGVAYVEFLVDGLYGATDYAGPYAWTWDTTALASGSYALTARAVDFAGNAMTSAPVTVTVLDQVAPAVALTAPMEDESVQGTVTLAAIADDAVGVTRVEFLVGPDVVATATTAPYTVSWNSASLGDGVYTVVARALDAAANSTESTPVSILVSNVGNASWSNGLKAPACSNAATKCFSGTLLDGRGPLGPEPGAPNTLAAACADGTQGSYHVDESIDAVTVRSSGGTLIVGGTAIVEVKLWAGQAYVMDALDIYFTADASAASPVWTRITTLTPAHAGAQVLSASYTLPPGTLQAVRAQLRYGGEAAIVCGGGTFDDRDDLVFLVNP